MNTFVAAPLINLLGFTIGIALYALLFFMVLRHPVRILSRHETNKNPALAIDWLLLATAFFGLLWNFGGLAELIWRDFLQRPVSPFLLAAAYSALGFLPAVVVHSAWHAGAEHERTAKARVLTGAAYLLSGFAAIWHFQAALADNLAPSNIALQILTFGYLAILFSLFLFTLRQAIERRAIWATALAVFAVSALHLSQPHENASFWIIELVAHQASLPLAMAILYQDFRFAFADLFLKRALSLFLLALTSVGLYLSVALPFLSGGESVSPTAPQTIGVLLGLMMATALVYPVLHRCAVWFVEKVILRRANYEKLRVEIAGKITALEPIEAVLEEVSKQLKQALTANVSIIEEILDTNISAFSLVNLKTDGAEILIATAEQPAYKIVLRDFAGGRRLLSDEIEMLGEVALQTARRIDVLRVTHQRCEQEFREQEFSKLATEAELRALRAQINPHFLFNALTTIGYLIQTAPDKALDTLLRLTQLLRGVLRSGNEFLTLDEELKLIESYLEIERARFEERLEIEIEAAPELLSLRVPSLILQPLVENAVKHGITPKKQGGRVKISAKRDAQDLILTVADSGAGIEIEELNRKRETRVGLNNVEQRLHLHYSGAANLSVKSAPENGTIVQIKIALESLKAKLPQQNLVALEK